ncbi:winged helix DNA-binding domain-containing protein [Antribacter sp. KLBMP9083]|uniref:Winged helix DNA-binding domain-containing protein n=1 Tax=Antribacter soli TaxID=2910976 RepID=A0AA41QE56_9MICO|nr:winged helix DNA-binding domain-containing protein [Antribacter soli]MCF4121804.1 winged helix DNA-binding domain-containing protein [Antribacter soli]
MQRLTQRDLNRTTLARQALLARADGTVTDVIGAVGGLQAQHARMPFVALWSRRQDQRIADLDDAVKARHVVKAHLMRSTLHLVPARDVALLDAVAAEQRLATWVPSARRAGLDLVELNAAVREFCAEPRRVDEIEEHVAGLHPGVDAAAAIPKGVTRAWWRLASAGGGLVQVPPAGTWAARGTPRYGDARAWVRSAVGPPDDPEEARAEVLARYLAAFGPVSAADAGRGLGLARPGQVKRALGTLDLRTYEGPDGRELVDLASSEVVPGDTAAPVRFLPRWEHLMVALAVRDRIIAPELVPAVYKRNADVLATFLVDGTVAGTWAVDEAGERAVLRLAPLADLRKRDKAAVADEAAELVRYLAPDALSWDVAWDA